MGGTVPFTQFVKRIFGSWHLIYFSKSIPFILFLFSGENSPVRFLYFWWRSWARNSRCTRGTFSAEVWQKIFSKEERRRFRLFYKIQNQKSTKTIDWSLKKGSNICKECQTKTGKWIFKGEEKWKVYLTGHNQNLVDYPTQLIWTWIFICVPWQS